MIPAGNPTGGPIAVWRTAMAIYTDRRVLAITFLGISSGLPLGILGDPLTAWLAEGGLTKTAIGLFALTSLPYSLKFLWAPVFDHLRLPFLSRLLGRRRGWAVITQLGLFTAVAALGGLSPAEQIGAVAALATGVAFLSASQDVVIDAYRVEILEERKLGAGAATIVLGYRVGQVGAGAFGLVAAAWLGWPAAFVMMGAAVAIGLVAILLNPEPTPPTDPDVIPSNGWPDAQASARLGVWLMRAVVAPFVDFARRPGWLAIILFILLYKLGDAVLSIMQTPFFLEIGFTKPEIAGIKKGVGFVAIIAGGFAGGLLVARYGILRSLMICGVLQAGSNVVFVWLAWIGHDPVVLAATVAAENLATGMGTIAFVAYLSSLCNRAYTATQYALLTSMVGAARVALSSSAGWLADQTDWVTFFMLTAVAALPGLAVLAWIMRRKARSPV